MGIKISGDFGWKNTRQQWKINPEGAVIGLQQQVGHFLNLPAFRSPGI